MTTTQHEVALLRLIAQRLAGPGLANATAAVRWLTAVQGQDHHGVLASVALRTAERTRHGVEQALNAGEIVKSWPMRGTLHLVVAEDLPWMLRLMTPRVIVRAAARRAGLGLDTRTLEQARAVAEDTLAGGHRITRQDLLEAWDKAGLATANQRGYHMLFHLAQQGVLCFGPVRDRAQQVVLVDEWIPKPRQLAREEALGELAWRYFASHGPTTVKDFIRWTGLMAADARAGLTLARPRLASIDVEGVEHLMDPQTPALLETFRSEARSVFLLPGFDELILGYQDRSVTLPTPHADLVVPGRNGVFRPTVLSDGHVVGTWQHTGRGAKQTITATPFTAFSQAVADAIPRVYADLP